MDKQTILNELQPLQGTKKVIVENQSTGDIIEGILDTHNRYKNQYDKIYKYFIGSSLNDTCNNIWQFLKDNVKYYVEPQKLQTLRSPAAILSKAADCKSYSLFANGILDAYRRNENKYFDVCYRFAGYTKPKRIEHVFSVCIDKKGNEIWTDAVLNGFNDRFTIPVYSRDKKINNMALVAMAGVPQNRNWRNQGVSYESVGNVPKIYYGSIGSIFDNIANFFNQKQDNFGKRKDVNYLDSRNTVLANISYLQRNPDVMNNWDDTPWAHYMVFGKNESRPQWIDIPGDLLTDMNYDKVKILQRAQPNLFEDVLQNANQILALLKKIDVSTGSGSNTNTGSGSNTNTGSGFNTNTGTNFILPLLLGAIAAKFLIFKK